MATKEATKIQGNGVIQLNVAERSMLEVDVNEYVIKMVDKNKRGQVYIAIFKPESKDDLDLVEMQKLKTANNQNTGG